MKVLLLGGTGTIGCATAHALARAGHEVIAFVRPGAAIENLPQCKIVVGQVTDDGAFRKAFADHAPEAVLSCIASRTGVAEDAWNIDYRANLAALSLAEQKGVRRFVLLSAICVQKPCLAFQKAKLAFETALRASDLTWSVVRPTAFFKSLSGQFERCRKGKPFLMFGDGAATACKPISNRDLADFLAACLSDPASENRILPIGGPGPAINVREQGEMLFDALGMEPRFRRVPQGLLSAIVAGLTPLGLLSRRLATKAELARIGQYYARESMLVWDAERGIYDADATPEYGSDTLQDHYRRMATEGQADERGAHAVF